MWFGLLADLHIGNLSLYARLTQLPFSFLQRLSLDGF